METITLLYIVIAALTVIVTLCLLWIYKIRRHDEHSNERLNKFEHRETRNKIVFSGSGMTQFDYDVATDSFIIINYDNIVSGKDKISMDDYLACFLPEDAAKCASIVADMRSGKDFSCKIDYRICSPNSSEVLDMLVSCVPLEKDANGKVIRYTGIRRDNTKWKMISTELEKNNLLLKTLMKYMPCMLFIKDVDDDYRYLIANNQFCAALGCKEDDVIGHTDYDMKETKGEADRFRRDDENAVKEGFLSFREETRWCGQRVVWHTTKSCLTLSSGQRMMIGMSLDVTSLDDTLKELTLAREKAERSDLLKSTFLANMSHEIRTPLNSIVGFSDLLLTTEEPKKKAEFGKIISHNSNLLLKLINDILDMSKIEAGFIDLKIELMSLTSLFDELSKSFEKMMNPNVKFFCENPKTNCIIESDKNRISQVVNNYMSNAIKYTQSGEIRLKYECVDDGVKISVKDTGIGIAEENKPRVFSRFEKFDSFAQGTGLGLSICKLIVETMGGEVGFSSQKDFGSIFWAWLPCRPIMNGDAANDGQEVYEPISEVKNHQHAGSAKRVLVVEDNDSNFILLDAILKDYIVERACNGLDAVNMARSGGYHIIFMDLKMPIMGGLEATRKIRAFDSHTQIVAVTANAFDSNCEDALKAGCNSFIAKPIRMADIIRVLDLE